MKTDAPGLDRARHLPISPLFTVDVPMHVAARMINELLYCERRFFFEWVQGEFEDNAFTAEGRAVRRRVDRVAPARKPSGKGAKAVLDADAADAEPERPYELRSLWLSDDALGITAKIDLVEGMGDGPVVPIEYKRVPERRGGKVFIGVV